MTIYIRVTKISGLPIENNVTMKAVQVSLLGQCSSDIYSFCRITPDTDNKYQSIISSDKIWEFPIDPDSPPCSIVVRLLDMEPEDMEIQRAILSTSWFNINTYVSEFFPLKPMVPCLGPAVALIDIHYVNPNLSKNQIFTPFECPKGEMAINPRWRNLKPFVPIENHQPQNQNTNNDNNNQDQNQIPMQEMQVNNLKPLIPDTENVNEPPSPTSSRFAFPSFSKKKQPQEDGNGIDFSSFSPDANKKINPYYVAFEKYSFDEQTLQLKYDEFQRAKCNKGNDQRRGSQTHIENQNKRRSSQNQIDTNAKRRGSQNQVDNNIKRRESHNQISRQIPAIHNKKQGAGNYTVID